MYIPKANLFISKQIILVLFVCVCKFIYDFLIDCDECDEDVDGSGV